MLTKRIDGNTYTQCDRCKRYNILLGKDDYMSVTLDDRGSYLLCPECAEKFKKMMEEVKDDNSI